MENYMADHSQYPAAADELLNDSPPYLNEDYFTGTHSGFTFTANLQSQTYAVTAYPISANHGSASFTIDSSGVIKTN